jgi:nucleotide-binding universal stress UspA family protein
MRNVAGREKSMKILVATDGSRGGAAALKFALKLAKRDLLVRLIVLNIGGRADAASAPSKEKGERFSFARQRREAKRIFDAAARRVPRSGPRVQFRFLTNLRITPVPEIISREADRLGVDLVIVGSEGRDTLSEWVVGGTALRLIYLARRPVTVVRPPRRRKTPQNRLAAAALA